MVARRYVRKNKQNGGSNRASKAFKTKSPGLMAKSWHYTKKGLGHTFRTPAYIVKGTSSALGGLVGLGTTRLGAAAIRGIQLRTAKRAQKREQRKIDALLGLKIAPTSGWGKFKKYTGIRSTEMSDELKQAKKADEIDALEKKVQSLQATGTSGKEYLKAKDKLDKLKIGYTPTTLTRAEGQSYVNALRQLKLGSIKQNNRYLYNIRQRKLTARQARVADANIQYKKSKKAVGDILSDTGQMTKKALVDVSKMSKKKIAALYTLAALGAPGATPVALIAMPIYDIVKTMGKDVPAIAKLGQRAKNFVGSRGTLMDEIQKRDEDQQKVKAKYDSQQYELTKKISNIDDTLLSSDEKKKLQTNIKTINEQISKINKLKIEIEKEPNNASRKEKEQKMIEEQKKLKQIKDTHNLFIQQQYTRAKTQLSPLQKQQLESVLDTSVSMVRMLDLQSDIQSRQRDIKRSLLQKQREDSDLIKSSLDPSSPIAVELKGKTKSFNAKDIDTIDMAELKKAYEEAKLKSYDDSSFKLPAKYFEALINLKIIKSTFKELELPPQAATS